jgi:DNA-binding MarR family transcriptional regulator
MYNDALLIAALSVLAFLTSSAIIYYKEIVKVKEEYVDAKNTISDIILSFNKSLHSQEIDIRSTNKRIDILSFDKRKIDQKIIEYDQKKLLPLDVDKKISSIEHRITMKIKEFDEEVTDIKASQKKMLQKISQVARARNRVQNERISDAKIEAAIPIKQEQALAPLTETELTVLRTIAEERKRTAPEIRNSINLTREHTARLMKKLYEAGYLERDTNKMPYTYHLKEEMERILKQVT